ncbi:hypothetical protein [Mycobacterium marinum]|uniref:hypothetical protein n=1 Tax=Mycobacterium marinum TaxID=1781 RepID=UPI0023581F0D|nr:hypothetical protein [Mycobacterium marinum]MDC8981244.1 hypothetical protein [Mycobacterium marinum]
MSAAETGPPEVGGGDPHHQAANHTITCTSRRHSDQHISIIQPGRPRIGTERRTAELQWKRNRDRACVGFRADLVIRQRPHQLTRGGGHTARCTCGTWVTPKTARLHLLCEVV